MKRHIEVLEDGITNSSGVLLASGTVKFFTGGTTTLKTVFKDFDLTIPHPNPLTLDAAGRITAFHDGRTKLVISDSAGALVRTVDNVGTEDSDVAAAAIALVDGDGLVRVPGTTQLNVNVDNSTINIVDDKIQLKDNGTTGDKFNANVVDDATIELASNKLQVKDDGIITVKILDNNVTRPKIVAVGHQVSSSSGAFSTNSASFVDVTNLSVTITTTGRPVMLLLCSNSSTANIGTAQTGAASETGADFAWVRDSTIVSTNVLFTTAGSAPGANIDIPPGSINFLDRPAAGTFTYKLQARFNATGTGNAQVDDCVIIAYEL